MSTHWSARPWKISRWRTEYPEEFPVTVTGKDSLPGQLALERATAELEESRRLLAEIRTEIAAQEVRTDGFASDIVSNAQLAHCPHRFTEAMSIVADQNLKRLEALGERKPA